jgi:putative ABC transport system ATP-binding protein
MLTPKFTGIGSMEVIMVKAVEAINLYKSYTLGPVEVEVLKDISLTIEEGEFVSVMGPSGSGKSTLLYMIGGLDKPTGGNIRVNGKELAGMKDKAESILRRRTIGFVFQFYNLIPKLTVEENVLMPVLLDGRRGKDCKEKLEEILKITGLTDRRHHTPRELSGGQQQRVAIARALINEPDIILADEPTGNLDSKTGTEIMQLLKDINREKGKTIIMVTHSLEAAGFGQRIINIKDGKVCEE